MVILIQALITKNLADYQITLDPKLIDFVYKYTNFNTVTNIYDRDLNLRITNNESDIQGSIVNIYGYLKSLSSTKAIEYYLLNNTIIKFDYKYIKKQFLDHIRVLINEIRSD